MMNKYVTIGIAGHVDHGKTSLVRTLTGIETDRLEEEKRRGLSIESGVAPFLTTGGLSIALVDVPGHTDFLKNTIRGLSCVDMAILVVAADDGVMPQTREHMKILDLFGAKTGFVVLSKADMVDRETLELAELEIKEVVRGSVFQGKPVIPYSALDRRGLEDVRSAIEEEALGLKSKSADDAFRLWIDQVSGVAGFGTVVTGTILSGTLSQDEALVLLPPGIETRARSLETHHKIVEKAHAGQRVGINLHKVSLDQVGRGMLLAAPGRMSPGFLLEELARTSGFGIGETNALLKEKERVGEVLSFRDKGFFDKKRYDQLKKQLPGLLQDMLSRDPMKRNVKAEELRRQLSLRLEEEPFQSMVSDLCREGKLVKIDGGFQLSGVSASLSPQQAKLAAFCMSYAQKCGFAPFSADTVWRLPDMKHEKQDIERMLSYLRNEGNLVRLKDGRYIPAECLEAIKEKVKGVVETNGVFTLDDLRTTLGYGRRIGVIVLEFLDSIGFTSRCGEGRVLRETISQS
jgi:small GTP-binding protein